jgi:renalase
MNESPKTISQTESFPAFGADVIVIGAGISGLLAATRLKEAGKSVIVLEKGRGFGGRMATRRHEVGAFDHGAQFFTAKSPEFQALVKAWEAQGLVKPWFYGETGESAGVEPIAGHPRYCGVQGMTTVPKSLGAALDVRCSTLAEKVAWESAAGWTVFCAEKVVYRSKNLILTAPVPQSLALLDSSSIPGLEDYRALLASVRYTKCITVMVQPEKASISEMPLSGALKIAAAEPLEWIGDNSTKGLSRSPAYTLQSGPDFGEKHWDSPDAVRIPPLLEAASRYTGKLDPETATAHRWGFSKPLNPLGERCLHLPEAGLCLAGDAFGGPRVEGAALSGLAAAKALLHP